MTAGRVRHWVSWARDTALASLSRQPCLLCSNPGPDPVCVPCSQVFERASTCCPRCGVPTRSAGVCGECLSRPPAFDATIAAWLYRFPLDRLIHAFKYHAQLPLGPWFARALASRLPPFDLVVGVPLHAERLRERGFNQAHEMARHLSLLNGASFMKSGLVRTRATGEQSRMTHDERARNVKGAFACDRRLTGQRIVVVDDVMTTGATLKELAKVLKNAGAASVCNAVVARATLGPPP